MSYRIEYEGASVGKNTCDAKRKTGPWMKGIYVLIVLCVVFFILFGNMEAVESIFIPGNPEITKAAFSSFTGDLQAGSTFKDALITFCREIIENAN